MDTEDPQAISALVAALRDAGAHGVMDFAAAKALIQGGSSIVITPLRAEMSSDNLDVRFNFAIVLLSIDGLHNEGSDEIVAHALRSSYRRIFASCSFTVKEDQNLFDGVKPVGCEEFPGGCSWNGWSVAKANYRTCSLITFNNQAVISILEDTITRYGDADMAFIFLTSGIQELYEQGDQWLRQHGYVFGVVRVH